MPGIAGIITHQPTGDEPKKLDIMLHCMMHESSYTAGSYSNPQLGHHVGFVTIKGSFSDCMPIYNEKKDVMLLFSGECFDDHEVMDWLMDRGHRFSTGGASYLVHLYEELGKDIFDSLNGWFSGIILDLRRGQIMLFNDRYGLQRVYYHQNEHAFFFSSEAKSLLKVLPSLRSPDLTSLGQYLAFDCVLENKTFFSDISLLPGGSVWSFTNGSIEKDQFFKPSSWEAQTILDRDSLFKELTATFRRILPRYFCNGSIGLSLTGGLDTRMILAYADQEPGELPCYTFGGIYRDSLDVRVARRVAGACHQTHDVLRADGIFLSEFPSLAEKTIFISDGVANICQSDLIYFNRLASEIAPIRMTGKFGTQVLRDFSALQKQYPDERLFCPEINSLVTLARRSLAEIKSGHSLSVILFKDNPWYWAGSTIVEASQLTVRSPYLDNDFVKLLYQAPNGVLPKAQIRCISEASPELYSIPTNRGVGGKTSPLVSKPRKIAFELIAAIDKVYNRDRLPYSLHHTVARLDQLLAPLRLDKLAIGFHHFRHYRVWFRRELSQYVKDMLLDDKTLNRPYWNKTYLVKIVDDHTRGHGNYAAEIRKVLTIELIHRLLLEEI